MGRSNIPATSSPMISVTISPHEQYFCTVSKSNVIKIWDLEKGAAIRTYRKFTEIYSAWIYETNLYFCQNTSNLTTFYYINWGMVASNREKKIIYN
jgi:WD40 repeat protein